jgi:hypothetical protein
MIGGEAEEKEYEQSKSAPENAAEGFHSDFF